MPNHIRVVIKPDNKFEEIEKVVISKYKNKEDEEKDFFDFTKIIPPPENMEQGGCSGEHPEGVICWYEWQIENWGTKWNSYDFDEWAKYDKQFSFQTAWSHPKPVVKKLSQMFPDVRFNIRYADEDIGNNLGEYEMRNGEVLYERSFTGNWSIEDEKELFARRVRDN